MIVQIINRFCNLTYNKDSEAVCPERIKAILEYFGLLESETTLNKLWEIFLLGVLLLHRYRVFVSKYSSLFIFRYKKIYFSAWVFGIDTKERVTLLREYGSGWVLNRKRSQLVTTGIRSWSFASSCSSSFSSSFTQSLEKAAAELSSATCITHFSPDGLTQPWWLYFPSWSLIVTFIYREKSYFA